MGNSEEGKPSSEKSSPPAMDQSNIHVYPDWATLQAYYRPRVALPSYYNPNVTSAHPPNPYMWGPAQAMMPPPYGTPYAAVYSHGGVYAHPAVPIGAAHTHSDAPTHSGNETLRVKIPGNQDQGLMKKLKGFDGLAMSIGNGNSDNGGTDSPRSQSGETEGSSNGYDGVRAAAGDRDLVAGKEGTTPEPVHHHHHHHHHQQQQHHQQQPSTVAPSNDRDLKRERRKQSNRESARRSRLRKQAETEELALRVESLGAENAALKSEIARLTDSSEKLRLQNAHLLVRMESCVDRDAYGNAGDGIAASEDGDPSSVAKLHQLLDTSSRADAVAAG